MTFTSLWPYFGDSESKNYCNTLFYILVFSYCTIVGSIIGFVLGVIILIVLFVICALCLIACFMPIMVFVNPELFKREKVNSLKDRIQRFQSTKNLNVSDATNSDVDNNFND